MNLPLQRPGGLSDAFPRPIGPAVGFLVVPVRMLGLLDHRLCDLGCVSVCDECRSDGVHDGRVARAVRYSWGISRRRGSDAERSRAAY